MAKIDVYTDDMASLSARLKRISSHIADAQKTAANVRRCLDFRVAAKLGIQNNITNAENKLKKQSARVLDLSKAAAVSAEEFKSADGQIDKKARNILGKITAVLVSTKDSVKKFFTSLAISRHKAINDIFLTTGAVAAGAGGVGVLAALKRIAEKQDKTLDDAASGSSAGINGAIGGAVVSGIVGERINNGGRHDGAKPEASGKATTGNTAHTESGAAAKAPTKPVKPKKPEVINTGKAAQNAANAGMTYYNQSKGAGHWKSGVGYVSGACGICCTAMIASYFGANITPSDLITANRKAGQNEAYFNTAVVKNKMKKEGLTYHQVTERKNSQETKINALENCLSKYQSDPEHNSPPIVQIHNGSSYDNHYVLVVGKDKKGNYIIVDPSGNTNGTTLKLTATKGKTVSGGYESCIKNIYTYTKS